MTAASVPAPATGPDAGAVWHYGDPLGEQRTAAESVVVVNRSHRAVLTLTGSDRLSWLHTISTQHVSGLPDGAVTENLNLDGQGRIEDHWLQTQLDGVTVLDTEASRAEPLLAYLTRMVFRADVRVEVSDLKVLSLLGPRAADVVQSVLDVTPPAPWCAVPLPGGGFVRTLDAGEVDVVTPAANVDDVHERLVAAGARPAGMWVYEAHRVAGLQPRLGVDTDDRTIPHEVRWIGGPGEHGAVHLDKGCYRGQETVARVHNLGKPPRHLVLLHLDGSADGRPETGDAVTADGRSVGRIGTIVDHFELGPVALALVKRTITPETPLVVGPCAAAIDPDSIPKDDGVQAGRQAVERLRGR